jgi:hypothetical protein
MGTFVTPPIDLYEESIEDLDRMQDDRPTRSRTWPLENGELDRSALQDGERRWDQVLGW